MTALTEEDAAHAFARAWRELDAEAFLSLLAPDATYASQWVFGELEGAAAIGDYLRGKMKTVREHGVNDPSARVRVETGRTSRSTGRRPCVLMRQGSDEVHAVAIFETANGRISRYDLCMPGMLGAVADSVAG